MAGGYVGPPHHPYSTGGPRAPFGVPGAGWTLGRSVPERLGTIREGVRWYLIVLSLQVLAAVLSAVSVGYVLGGGTFGSSAAGVSGSTGGTGGQALALLASLVALLDLVLIVVSWLKWREGVRTLPEAAGPYGPSYVAAASEAARDCGRAVWSFLAIVVSVVGFAVVVAAVVAGQELSHCTTSGTSAPSCPPVALSTGTLVGYIIGFGLVLSVLEFLLYYFASQSLVSALRPLAAVEDQHRLDRGRLLLRLGVALAPIGIVPLGLEAAGHSTPALAVLGLLTPVLLLCGMSQIDTAYGSWVSAHPPAAGGDPRFGVSSAPSWNSSAPPSSLPPPATPYGPPPGLPPTPPPR